MKISFGLHINDTWIMLRLLKKKNLFRCRVWKYLKLWIRGICIAEAVCDQQKSSQDTVDSHCICVNREPATCSALSLPCANTTGTICSDQSCLSDGVEIYPKGRWDQSMFWTFRTFTIFMSCDLVSEVWKNGAGLMSLMENSASCSTEQSLHGIWIIFTACTQIQWSGMLCREKILDVNRWSEVCLYWFTVDLLSDWRKL